MAKQKTSLEQLQALLATNLRTYRKEAGYSQEGLALEAGVDRTYVSQMERGIGNPSLGVLCRLADILGLTVQDLLMP